MTYEASLTALADPTRRRIYERILERPRSVGELASELPVSRPAVSQHLRVLSDAALARSNRQGSRRVYSARPEGLAELRSYLERMWGHALGAFAVAAEMESQQQRRRRGGRTRR